MLFEIPNACRGLKEQASMKDNNRRYFSPEQGAILREHLIEGKAVSDLCDIPNPPDGVLPVAETGFRERNSRF